MKPLAIMTAATLTALSLMLASPVAAFAPATDETPRPKPRPIMDCWINHDTGATDCRVRG